MSNTMIPQPIPQSVIADLDASIRAVERWAAELATETYVRWRKGDIDRTSRFPNNDEAQDFAHSMADLGYSICIGPDSFIQTCIAEESL